MSGSTEDNILNTIPDFADNASETSEVGGASDSGASSTGATGQTDGGGGVDRAGNTSSAEPSRTGSTAHTPAPTDGIQRRHDGLIERPNADNPNTRDLVDPVTGQIVARGGVERHVFELGQRHARENNSLKQQLATAQQGLAQRGEVDRVARDLNIAPENQVVALRVMSDFLKDPVKTLEYLVAEVKSKGYTIPFLTDGISQGIDLQAVSRLIETKMAPLTQQQQREAQHQHNTQQAQTTLDTFLGTYPQAEANLGTLAEMMMQQPSLSLHDAYIQLISWSSQQGYDATRPLGPQIHSRFGDPRNAQQAQQPQQPQQFTRPLPNGRSSANGLDDMSTAAQFNENSSWSDIIRSAMRESTQH